LSRIENHFPNSIVRIAKLIALGSRRGNNRIVYLMCQIGDLMMQEKEAKTVFDMGGFSKAMIVPTPMGSGFHLHLVRFGKAGTEVVERQRGGWRVFSSIDAAANTAHGIGFRRIEIDLSSR